MFRRGKGREDARVVNSVQLKIGEASTTSDI